MCEQNGSRQCPRRALGTRYVNEGSGLSLHQFSWVSEHEIGELPTRWNHLVGYDQWRSDAALEHYTTGGPWFEEYRRCEYAPEWFAERERDAVRWRLNMAEKERADMQVPESWLSEAFATIAAAAVAGIGWCVRNTIGRIRRLADCTVRKSDFEKLRVEVDKNEDAALPRYQFEEFAERAETDRRELREGVMKLFDKLDEIKDILIQKETR